MNLIFSIFIKVLHSNYSVPNFTSLILFVLKHNSVSTFWMIAPVKSQMCLFYFLCITRETLEINKKQAILHSSAVDFAINDDNTKN